MVFLHEHGVGTARAVRIFKTYGTDAVQVMSENPYRLARDIRGIGFRTADVIAEKLGIEKTAMIRVRAGISFALTEAMGDGHCGLPRCGAGRRSREAAGGARRADRRARPRAGRGHGHRGRVGDTDCVFLSGLYHAERGIAERLRRLMAGPCPGPRSMPTRRCRGSSARPA
jgi:exodeoxyribonuclease V alpha subunit